MKYCFIINPMAGKGKSVDGVCADIERVCSERGVEYEVFLSKCIGDTKTHVAKRAAEGEEICFIAGGGDGTLCETTLAVMALPEDVRKNACVGVIPMGTGNDFASNFDNKEAFFDIAAQLDHTPYEVDLIRCNDLYSINMINVGFDSHVVCQKEKIGRKKWVPRKLSYIISLLITLIKKPGLCVDLVCDGKESVHMELLLTTFANGAFCGGGFNSNPYASLTDGKIDFISINNVGRIKFLTLVKFRTFYFCTNFINASTIYFYGILQLRTNGGCTTTQFIVRKFFYFRINFFYLVYDRRNFFQVALCFVTKYFG